VRCQAIAAAVHGSTKCRAGFNARAQHIGFAAGLAEL
jgi:hypothetical protein